MHFKHSRIANLLTPLISAAASLALLTVAGPTLSAPHRGVDAAPVTHSTKSPQLAVPSASAPAPTDRSSRLAALPVPFTANAGETDSRVAFYARTFAGTVFVTNEGRLVYALPARQPGTQAAGGWALAESFPSASAAPRPAGGAVSATRVSRFTHRSPAPGEVPTFDDIRLGEVAPGIEARLRATGTNVEKLFTVAPGADAAGLRVRVDGASGLAVRSDGALAVSTGVGDVVFTAPIAWQDADSGRKPVAVRYVLAARDGEYGFALGSYDRSRPVVIDPLIRSTFAGGGADDAIRAIAVHPGTFSVYAAGYTRSTNFPGTTGAIPGAQSSATVAGGQEAFVAQYNPSLTALVRASYYGGDGTEEAKAIAIHPNSGDVYIAGTTTSNTGTLMNAQRTFSGGVDGFIARFDGALSSVLSATFYGGTGIETIWGIAIDQQSGNVFVAGDTTSPTLESGAAGSVQVSNAGAQDAFVARLSANLQAVVRATFYGGLGADRALGIALDVPSGDVVLAGSTTSTTLPVVATGAFPSFSGGTDGFVVRLDGDLTKIRMSSYFGGSDVDQVNAVAIHPISGDVYAGGETRSLSIPAQTAAQATIGGGVDGFVVRFHSDLTGVRAFTYFGKLGDDAVKAIAISKYNGEVYIAGATDSAALPTSAIDGPQTTNGGGLDGFVARLDAALAGVKQSSFFGSAGADAAWSIALTDTTAYIGGETTSAAMPASTNGAQPAKAAGSDGFVAAFTSDLVAGNSNPLPFGFVPATNRLPSTLQVSAPTQVIPSGTALAYVDGQPGSSWCASTAADCSCDKTGNVYVTGEALIPVQTPGTPYYVCVRHVSAAAPDAVTESRLHIGGVTGTFRVATGGGAGLIGCTLDIDGNGIQDALTDGLLVLRALFGLSGSAATNNAVGANASRPTWTEIKTYLNTNCGATIP